MEIYNWEEYQAREWDERYPESVRGFNAWRNLRSVEQAPQVLLEERRSRAAPSPCIFVSHRQADKIPAIRIAYLACLAGFDYWLDVLDPLINSLPGASPSGPTPRQKAYAIAGIVEMALLNSTHVVAVMTPRTEGSQWVPYEYGRVKEPLAKTLQACCWVDPRMHFNKLPYYLHLGKITKSEAQLRAWLRTEARKHGIAGRNCSWVRPIPSKLGDISINN